MHRLAIQNRQSLLQWHSRLYRRAQPKDISITIQYNTIQPTASESKYDEPNPSMEPPLKKVRVDTFSEWAAWDSSIATAAATDAASNANRNMNSDIETEMATYFFLTSTIPRKENPLIWWRMNELHIPLLCWGPAQQCSKRTHFQYGRQCVHCTVHIEQAYGWTFIDFFYRAFKF